MKKYLLAFILTLISATCISAATAEIHKVWLEHGVSINGRKAMKVHCDFTVHGMNGKQGNMCIWLKGPSGNWHKVNSEHRTSDGTPYFKWAFNPKYNDAHYSDFWFAPYIDDLRMLSGKNSYTVIVTINDNNGKILTQSSGVKFNGTGSGSNSNSPAPSPSQPKKQSPAPRQKNHIVESHREELNYGGYGGGFVIVDKYSNGCTMHTQYGKCSLCLGSTTCRSCHGTGLCSLCNGQGGIISAGYGTFIPCAGCNRTGACHLCNGSKRCGGCSGSNNKYPGYTPVSTTVFDPNGRIMSMDSFNSYRSEERDTERTRTRRTCPDCGGTKLWRRGKEPEFAMPASQLIGHYNKAGEKCPYCNSIRAHWHSRCTTCKDIPGTDNPYK